jgi:hypothetical protein
MNAQKPQRQSAPQVTGDAATVAAARVWYQAIRTLEAGRTLEANKAYTEAHLALKKMLSEEGK